MVFREFPGPGFSPVVDNYPLIRLGVRQLVRDRNYIVVVSWVKCFHLFSRDVNIQPTNHKGLFYIPFTSSTMNHADLTSPLTP